MNERRHKGCLIAALVWLILIGLLAVAYRFLVHPHVLDRLEKATSGTSQYRDEIVVALDSFSGYCLLRSDALREDLKQQQIRLTLQDDRADYTARLRGLKEGRSQLAAFTIDSLITSGAKAGDFPGSIVLVLDETAGGDAIVAYQAGVKSLQDLGHPSARIVLTPNSPSEFLARVVLAHFNLPGLPDNWLTPAKDAADVLRQFRAASPSDRKAFVLWQPYVSRALQQKDAHVLLDSSRLRGYIVDVLVARRQFLQDRPELVRTFLEAYARTAYRYSQETNGLVQLVKTDARQTGSDTLDDTQAATIVNGIRWKNVLENYAHFRLARPAESEGVASLEDMIANVIDVLVKTKALPGDPLAGRHNTLYYDRLLGEMRAAQFHPAKGLNLVHGLGPDPSLETVRHDQAPAALSPEQWQALRAVGELRTQPIVFRRGLAEVSLDSERDLQELARRLQAFPRFYVRVIGHARAEGDPEANRALAQARAEAAAQHLIRHGVLPERIRAETALPAAGGAEAQAVSFFVGQMPY